MEMNPFAKLPQNHDAVDLKHVIQYFGTYKLRNSPTINSAAAPPSPPQHAPAINPSVSKIITIQRNAVEQTSHNPTREQDLGENVYGPSFNLRWVQEILDGGDDEEIAMLVLIFQGSYLDLMIEPSLSEVFRSLVHRCRGDLLDLVFAEVLSSSNLFIDAAFSAHGASSIIKLINKVKKPGHAYSIVQALSTQFFDIMTHQTAKAVIHHCFICFPHYINKILYERAIDMCLSLATDKVGCRSLNKVIPKIPAKQRPRLLNMIADWSYHLSNDPYRNYVVQGVLSLKNDDVSNAIVLRLRGKFVELARHKAGSRVVQKCIEASDFGFVSVVEEIVLTPGASLELSLGKYGNYVIQAALKKTKGHWLKDVRLCLVKSLEAYCIELSSSIGGRMVMRLIKDEGQTSTSDNMLPRGR